MLSIAKLLPAAALFLAIALAPILGLSAASGPALAGENGPVYGGVISTGSIGDATGMLPMITTDSSSSDAQGYIYNGLLKYDKDLNLVGDLAESWQVSPDGLVITFKLRKGVTFQDGHPYTSADALYSYQFMIDPKVASPYAGDYLKVAKAESPDDHTFRVYYNEPYAPGLGSWTLPQLPAHLLKGTEVRSSPLIRHPVGTGPYILKEWATGQRLVFSYYPDYFEGRACLSQVVTRIIPDMATMFLELKAGGLDMMGLTALQYRRQTESDLFRERFRKYRYLASAYTYLGYNLKVPLFQDRRVRQALSYAIDKEEIIRGVLLGLGRPATGPFKPGTYWYNPKVMRFPYRPDKARELLAQAGWTDSDGDGVLDKDGKPFAFTIITNQGNSYRQNTAVIIQNRLAKVGIQVTIRAIEWAAFIKEFINKGRYEATLLGWTMPPEPDPYAVWHSDNTGPGKLNFVDYKNPELDELLIRGQKTFDRAERKAIYDRVQEILAVDQPYTFLYVPDALPMVAARFQGIRPAPAGISYNFIHWWVPKAQQHPALVR